MTSHRMTRGGCGALASPAAGAPDAHLWLTGAAPRPTPQINALIPSERTMLRWLKMDDCKPRNTRAVFCCGPGFCWLDSQKWLADWQTKP